MKVVVIKSPKALRGLLRTIFRIPGKENRGKASPRRPRPAGKEESRPDRTALFFSSGGGQAAGTSSCPAERSTPSSALGWREMVSPTLTMAAAG